MNNCKIKVLVYSVCDYDKLPNGGEVFLLNNFLTANIDDSIEYYLVGITFNKEDTVGKWNIKKFGNKEYKFFPVSKVLKDKEKTHIPFRLRVMLGIKHYWNEINQIYADYHYIHEAELAIPMWDKKISIVYHGHGDPCQTLKISRFPLFRAEIFTKLYWKVISKTLKKCCCLIWAADRSKELYITQQPFMEQIVRSKSYTIHSSFDTKLVVNKNRLSVDKTKIQLITVGRLSRVKRIDFLIEVVSNLIRKGYDVNFLICGDGEEKKSLKDLCRKLGIENEVQFLGLADRELIATALNESDVFLFASENEAMSLVVLESLYMGTPVVSTDVGDIAYAVKNGVTGYIVNSYDIEEYCDKVIQVIKKGKSAYSDNCKNISLEYTPQKMAESINGVFYELNKNAHYC